MKTIYEKRTLKGKTIVAICMEVENGEEIYSLHRYQVDIVNGGSIQTGRTVCSARVAPLYAGAKVWEETRNMRKSNKAMKEVMS